MFSTPDVPDAMPSVREAAIVAAAGQGWSHEVIARTAGVDEPTSGGCCATPLGGHCVLSYGAMKPCVEQASVVLEASTITFTCSM